MSYPRQEPQEYHDRVINIFDNPMGIISLIWKLTDSHTKTVSS